MATAEMTRDSGWARPAPTRRGLRLDALLAGIVLVGMLVSWVLYSALGYYDDPAPVWVALVVIGCSTVPLAWRRRHPEIPAVIVSIAFALSQILRVPELLICNIALFIAIYSVGAWSRHRRRATMVRVLIVIGMFVWLITAMIGQANDPEMLRRLPGGAIIALGAIQIVTNALYFGGAYYFGDRAWAAARSRAALESKTAELAAERETSAQQAIALERVRIARELHDVVAHHVSVMGIQAGAARRVLAADPAKAASALESIESSARSAVDELHGLLTTLREDGTDDAPSVTGIDQLDALVREVEQGGVPIRFQTIGAARPLAATTSATAYRVAQEAITNAVKHAGAGTAVDLRVRYRDTDVEIEVTDNGRGVAGRPTTGSGGLGLIGMRERVTAVGGALEVGPRSRGGFLVRATLPAVTVDAAPGATDAAVRAEPGTDSGSRTAVPADAAEASA